MATSQFLASQTARKPEAASANLDAAVLSIAAAGSDTSNEDARADELLGPIIKTLFETGQQQAFLDKLKSYIAKKDQEIDKLSTQHFQSFVVSVGQLLSIQQDTQDLKKKIIELNEQLQDAGRTILEKERTLSSLRRIQKNLLKAIQTLKTCILICTLALQIDQHYLSGRYYTALKTIDKLEATNAPLSSRYEFCHIIQKGIPNLREEIKQTTIKAVQDWFVNVRQKSKAIGRLAMLQYQRSQQKLADAADDVTKNADDRVFADQISVDVLENENVNVSLIPIYQCLHVFMVLGQKTKFESYYTENRKLQADLVLTASFTLGRGNLIALEEFLADIVGFFVVEGMVSSTTDSSFLKSALVDDLWDSTSSRIKTLLSNQIIDCVDLNMMDGIKDQLLMFVFTLEHFGFQTIKLIQLLSVLSTHFLVLLSQKTSISFAKVLADETWEGLEVMNEEEWKKIQRYVPTQHITISKREYPKRLPFSQSVVDCGRLTKKFVDNYYKFIQGFPSGYSQFDTILKEAVDQLLINCLNRAFLDILDDSRLLNFSQAVQILINIAYLEDSVQIIERDISQSRYAHRGVILKLSAARQFRQTIFRAKDVAARLLSHKINDFIDLEDIDWTPSAINNKPSPYLIDLTAYLKTVFESTLANVPSDIRNLFYIAAVEHLATAIYGQLLNPTVKHFNLTFIENLHIDVVYCIAFVNELPLPMLASMFEELVQLITLCRSNNMEEYLNEKIRRQKYPQLHKENVALLLEKLREPLFSFKQVDKTRQRAIDAVIKGLKS